MAIFLAIFDLCRFDGFLSLLSGCLVIVLVRRELCAGFFSLSTCFGGFGPRFSRVNGNFSQEPPWPDPYLISIFPILCPQSLFCTFLMGDNLRLKMQNINLGADDEPVAMPPAMCVQAVAVNQFSLVVVPLNLRKQNLRVMSQLPRLWGVDNAVGRIIAANRVQFIFQSEESMLMVTRRAPWSFAEWMVTVSRWYPNIADEDLKIIPFLVQIRGIPLEFLTRKVVEFIGGILAPVFNVDFDENSARVDFVQVQVLWNVDHPLRF